MLNATPKKKFEKPVCECCGRRAEGPVHRSDRSGFFFLDRRCNRTWDLDGRPNPWSRPGFSYRERVTQAAVENGLDPEECIAALGLVEAARMFGVAA